MTTDEQPLRADKPEPLIERQENGPLPAQPRYKEDYRRTQRNGENVYCLIEDSEQIITGEEFRQLKSRKDTEASSKSDSLNSKKSEWQGIDLSFLTGGGALSKKEAEDLYEPLITVLKDDGTYLDKAIALKNPTVEDSPIWGNITDDEAAILAELLLKAGLKSPFVATTIRASIEVKSYAAAIAILGPRIQLTALAVRTPQQSPVVKRWSLFRPLEAAQ